MQDLLSRIGWFLQQMEIGELHFGRFGFDFSMRKGDFIVHE